jgi:hypothetical protein
MARKENQCGSASLVFLNVRFLYMGTGITIKILLLKIDEQKRRIKCQHALQSLVRWNKDIVKSFGFTRSTGRGSGF